MIVSVTLNLIITPAVIAFVIIPMIVCTHGLMLIRAMLVGSILRADQRRGQCRHAESRYGEQCRFPRMLAHVAFSFRVGREILWPGETGSNSPPLAACVGASLRPWRESTHPTRC
jgi:hypothetical protein